MKKLTPKQKRFVDEYLVDLNATAAATRAGYSEKTAQVIGSENLSKPIISEAIANAMKKVQERIEYTADDWRRDVMRLAETSEQDGDITNALKGRDMLGKSLGIYTEGRNLTSSDGSMTPKGPDLTKLSTEALIELRNACSN